MIEVIFIIQSKKYFHALTTKREIFNHLELLDNEHPNESTNGEGSRSND